MQQPRFWNDINLVAILLLPLSFLYSLLSKANLFIQSLFKYRSKVKIICVGNINIGGTGKTQVVLKLSEIFLSKKLKICIVMQGYKSKLSKENYATIVDLKKHSATVVGDEPLMIALKLAKYKNVNIIINNSKKLSVKCAEKFNPDIIIMDDGMQNESIKKYSSILVVDGNLGFGNKLTVPSGPLRESISSGMKKTDAVIIIRKDKKQIREILSKYNIPVFHGEIKSELQQRINDKKIFAFCAIGNPDKFFDSMRLHGFCPDKIKIFSDHHMYTERDIKNIIDTYSKNYIIFTTDKDYVKVPQRYKKYIKPFSVKLKITENDVFNKFVLSLIN